jgi:hypothetical protein
MANFDQAPLVSFEQFAESLNGGMGAVSKMSQLDFFGKAALATSQARQNLESKAGNSQLVNPGLSTLSKH